MSRRRKRSGGSRLAAAITTLCMIFLMSMVPLVLIAAARQHGAEQEKETAVQTEEKISNPESVPVQSIDPDAQEGEDIPAQGGDNLLILVNAQHPMPEDYASLELEKVQGDYQMDRRAAGPMRQMISDARTQGVELLLCSAYRTRARQEVNFQNSVNSYMTMGYSEDQAVMATARLIAVPGTSEHETGLAADIVTPSYQRLDAGYAGTAAARWLLENAASYGFVLRYPEDKTEITGIDFEPWHYRYVGAEAAKEIMSQGLCLEEYVALRERQDA